MVGVNTVNGDLSVETSATLLNANNLTIGGILNYTGSGTTTLTGDIAARGILISDGTLNDGGNTITITGNGSWTKNGGTFVNTGEVIFAGTEMQTIAGSSPTTFNNLIINNSSSSGVMLNQPIAVSGYFLLAIMAAWAVRPSMHRHLQTLGLQQNTAWVVMAITTI